MADDLKMTAEMAAIEARLGGIELAPLRIDREGLMYRAGWAACATSIERETPRRARGVTRSLITHGLAAALAVAATIGVAGRDDALELPRHRIVEQRYRQPGGRPAAIVTTRLPDSTSRRLSRIDVDAALAAWESSGRALVASPWNVAAEGAPTEAGHEESNAATDLRRRATTARELMEELLPRAGASKLGRG